MGADMLRCKGISLCHKQHCDTLNAPAFQVVLVKTLPSCRVDGWCKFGQPCGSYGKVQYGEVCCETIVLLLLIGRNNRTTSKDIEQELWLELNSITAPLCGILYNTLFCQLRHDVRTGKNTLWLPSPREQLVTERLFVDMLCKQGLYQSQPRFSLVVVTCNTNGVLASSRACTSRRRAGLPKSPAVYSVTDKNGTSFRACERTHCSKGPQ